MDKFHIGVIVGSLSSTSINRRLAHALMKLAPECAEFSEISFRELPLYSQDYDATSRRSRAPGRRPLAKVDAVLFVTPEYNRSIPGGLKNAIDWASRPYGAEQFQPQALRGDRCLAGRDRHRGRTAAPAQPAQFLQCAADEFAGGLYPYRRTCSTTTTTSSTNPRQASCTSTWPILRIRRALLQGAAASRTARRARPDAARRRGPGPRPHARRLREGAMPPPAAGESSPQDAMAPSDVTAADMATPPAAFPPPDLAPAEPVANDLGSPLADGWVGVWQGPEAPR
jgi:multimeric flavodoxin WrbA